MRLDARELTKATTDDKKSYFRMSPSGQKSVVVRLEKTHDFPDKSNLVDGYKSCKQIVLDAGFKKEIDWQDAINLDRLTESSFLQEHAWVTLSSGMKVRIIEGLFRQFSEVFFDWKSAELIAENEELCRVSALKIFGSSKKVNAILTTSRIISIHGFSRIKELITRNPFETLSNFPYIGPVTYYHLAKNIGIPVAKPDRHLSRLANCSGFQDVQEFCEFLSRKTGDRIQVIDIVLWRYATITRDYIEKFSDLVKG